MKYQNEVSMTKVIISIFCCGMKNGAYYKKRQPFEQNTVQG